MNLVAKDRKHVATTLIKEVENHSSKQLESKFLLRIQSFVDLTENFEEIIQKTYQTIQNQDKQNHADIVSQLLGKESDKEAHNNCNDQEDKTSHGWSPSFSLVLLDILVHLLTCNLCFSIKSDKGWNTYQGQ